MNGRAMRACMYYGWSLSLPGAAGSTAGKAEVVLLRPSARDPRFSNAQRRLPAYALGAHAAAYATALACSMVYILASEL